MSEPYLGEIRLVSFAFAPKFWALCNGQILSIQQNTALFSLLGTTYGGNGQTTFALPNLQGRAPMHVGNGFIQGEFAGEQAHTLIASEMPQHTHTVSAKAAGSTSDPTNAMWATSTQVAYASTANTTMAGGAIGSTGNSSPHDNMPPYLVLNFVIALEGIFPSRN